MCGIIGANFTPKNPSSLLKLIQDRGPDHQEYKIIKNNFFAHSRLAIIDLDNNSNQPMVFDDICLVFNGEIYNYKSLINQYNLKLITKSDSEVIIRLYQKKGFEFLNELNGAFAFCLYDKNKDLFFCARDRFGKKPFYYYFKDNKFIFSSLIKPILKILDYTPKLNFDALNEYLSFFAPISNITFYKDILKLPKASYIILQNNTLKIKKYYKIKTKKYIFDNDLAISEVKKNLIEAIKIRLNADVEIGVLLSGGLDSSLIAFIYNQLLNKKIKTFSIGYDEFRKYDELNYAKILSNHIKSEHFEVKLNKNEFIQNFDKVIEYLEEPFGDSSAHPLYKLTKIIKDTKIKTVFSGEGSDELFFGYEKYFKLNEFYQFSKTLSINQINFFKKNLSSFISNSKESIYFNRILNNEAIYQSFGETFSYNQKKALFNKHIKGIKFTQDKDKFDYMSKIDLNLWIGEVLLQKLDKIALSNAVESRNPFLDYNLVDLVFKIDNKIRAKSQKYILKQIAQKYLPSIIINRKKKGFNSPFNEWLFSEYDKKLLEIILQANNIHNYFNQDYLFILFNYAKKNKFRQHFYLMYLFSRWFLKTF